MATKNLTVSVSESFDFDSFCNQLAEEYRQKGFNVQNPSAMGTIRQIIIEKDNDGIQNYLGLGTQEEINITYTGNTLNATFNDGCQTMRFIAIGLGWFICFVPFITGIMGMSKHSNFTKELENSIRVFTAQN